MSQSLSPYNDQPEPDEENIPWFSFTKRPHLVLSLKLENFREGQLDNAWPIPPPKTWGNLTCWSIRLLRTRKLGLRKLSAGVVLLLDYKYLRNSNACIFTFILLLILTLSICTKGLEPMTMGGKLRVSRMRSTTYSFKVSQYMVPISFHDCRILFRSCVTRDEAASILGIVLFAKFGFNTPLLNHVLVLCIFFEMVRHALYVSLEGILTFGGNAICKPK